VDWERRRELPAEAVHEERLGVHAVLDRGPDLGSIEQ
jgi:hypothetical protein